MSNLLWKKLHLCFSSTGSPFKSSPSIPSSPPSTKTNHNRPFHRRHHHHHCHRHDTQTQSIFIHNFNFLYDHISSPHHHHRRNSSNIAAAEPSKDGGVVSETEFSAGFATVFSSKLHRRGGAAASAEELGGGDAAGEVTRMLSGRMAMMKHVESSDPYVDFRKSMREMVESRNLTRRDVAEDREFLHELLFCYLSLNPKHTHKFIVSAFADTLVSLLSPPPPPPPPEIDFD